jgi:hypothetical protein
MVSAHQISLITDLKCDALPFELCTRGSSSSTDSKHVNSVRTWYELT